MMFIWRLVFHDNDDDDKDDQLMTVHDRSHRVWWCCCWSHRNQLMGFPNAKSSPHPPFLPWFIKWLFHQAATNEPSLFPPKMYSLPLLPAAMRWWLMMAPLQLAEIPKTTINPDMSPHTETNTFEKHTMIHNVIYSNGFHFRMLGHQWWNGGWILSLNIYFIRKGSLLQGIPTNHLAPKHQLSRAQKLVNSFMQGVTRGFSCPRTTRDPGSRDLPPCEFQQQTSSNNLTKWNNKGHATLTINSCCTYLGVLKSSSEMN